MHVPKEIAVKANWAVVDPFYREFARKLQQMGIAGLTTGGNACIAYHLAQATKDCDIIVPVEHCEQLVRVLAATSLGGMKPHYTLKYGAPFARPWTDGGWSSHTYFGPANDPTARLDFFARPPRVENPSCDEHQLYLSRDGVARMKKTCRDRDWAFANLLGVQMLQRKDERGLLHVHTPRDLIEAISKIKPTDALLAERPILKLAQGGHPELERYLKAEIEFWKQLDELRLSAYAEAWKPYGKQLQAEKGLQDADLEAQHERLVKIANDLLDPDPLQKVGERALVEKAKAKTQDLFRELDTTLLPTPNIIPRTSNLAEL